MYTYSTATVVAAAAAQYAVELVPEKSKGRRGKE
jgi:hypothetical protein